MKIFLAVFAIESALGMLSNQVRRQVPNAVSRARSNPLSPRKEFLRRCNVSTEKPDEYAKRHHRLAKMSVVFGFSALIGIPAFLSWAPEATRKQTQEYQYRGATTQDARNIKVHDLTKFNRANLDPVGVRIIFYAFFNFSKTNIYFNTNARTKGCMISKLHGDGVSAEYIPLWTACSREPGSISDSHVFIVCFENVVAIYQVNHETS